MTIIFALFYRIQQSWGPITQKWLNRD